MFIFFLKKNKRGDSDRDKKKYDYKKNKKYIFFKKTHNTSSSSLSLFKKMNFTITLDKTDEDELGDVKIQNARDFLLYDQTVSLLVVRNKSIDSDISSIDLSYYLSKILAVNKNITHIMFDKINFNQLHNPFEWVQNLVSELELNFHDCLLKYRIGELNKMIASSQLITKIWLIRTGDLDHEDIVSFSSAISTNTSIKSLFIDKSPVNKDFFRYSSFSGNKTLELVSLMSVNLQENGVISFIQPLSDNMQVKTLILVKCKLSDPEMKTISESLASNKTIKDVCLSFNHCGLEGSKALANLIRINQSITSLNLSWNKHMTTEGIDSILSALEENHTLSELKLIGTGFNDDNAKTLVNALATNFTRRKIYLRDNDNSLASKGITLLMGLTIINPLFSFDLTL